jgi:DNA-binding MarR family transcriptional regulator
LDSIQIKLLNAIVLLWYDKKEGNVGDLMGLTSIASPATIHAALKKLTQRKLIQFRQASDSRARYVELTELGLKRFNDLANTK